MSKPSILNIDLWLFELSEGNLSPEKVQQLELFLLHHPELDVDRDMWEAAKVDKTTRVYPNVKSLERKRKPIGFYVMSSLALFFLMWGGYISFDSEQSHEIAHSELLQNQRAEIRTRILAELSVSERMESENSNALKDEMEGRLTINKLASVSPSKLMYRSTYSSVSRNGFDNTIQKNRFALEGNPLISTGRKSKSQQTSVSKMMAVRTERESTISGEVSDIDQIAYKEDSELIHKEDLADWILKGNIERLAFSDDESEIREPRTSRNFAFTTEQVRRRGGFGKYSGQSGYSTSLKTKISRFGHSIRRMMDNPVALKNSRDPKYLVPGLSANDISFSSAGTLLAIRVLANSRIQWLGKSNEQLMSQVSVDGYSYGIRGGWGVQFDHNMYKDGGIHVGQVALSYSPKISVSNRISVEPSVRFKMGSKRLNISQMDGVGQVELERGNVHEFYQNNQTPIGKNLWYKDLGLGLLVNTKWFFVGAQVDNIFKHKDNIYSSDLTKPRRVQNSFMATVGTDWESIYSDLSVSPYIVYQKNERLSELWAGLTVDWNGIELGLAGSSNLDPAASLGMNFDRFSFTYKADYTKSIMTQERSLSHQITLRFLTGKTKFTRH